MVAEILYMDGRAGGTVAFTLFGYTVTDLCRGYV